MVKISIVPWIVKKLKRCIGIVEDTDTASQAIASNKYVIWKGDVCKSTSAISEGDTLSSSNLSAVNDGIGNDLSQAIANLDDKLVKKGSISGTTSSGNLETGLHKDNVKIIIGNAGSSRIAFPYTNSAGYWYFSIKLVSDLSNISNQSVTVDYLYINA